MPYFRLSRLALALVPLAPLLMTGCASIPRADAAKPADTAAIAAAAAHAATDPQAASGQAPRDAAPGASRPAASAGAVAAAAAAAAQATQSSKPFAEVVKEA